MKNFFISINQMIQIQKIIIKTKNTNKIK